MFKLEFIEFETFADASYTVKQYLYHHMPEEHMNVITSLVEKFAIIWDSLPNGKKFKPNFKGKTYFISLNEKEALYLSYVLQYHVTQFPRLAALKDRIIQVQVLETEQTFLKAA